MIKFESPLEELMYPELKKIAEMYDFDFCYQFSVNVTEIADWFSDKVELGEADEEDLRLWADEHDVPTSFTYEKYRIDFVFKGHGLKIAIEIDGKEFHDDIDRESERDEFLENDEGYIVWHFVSDEIINLKRRQRTIELIIARIESFKSVQEWKCKQLKNYWVKKWMTAS